MKHNFIFKDGDEVVHVIVAQTGYGRKIVDYCFCFPVVIESSLIKRCRAYVVVGLSWSVNAVRR